MAAPRYSLLVARTVTSPLLSTKPVWMKASVVRCRCMTHTAAPTAPPPTPTATVTTKSSAEAPAA